MANTTKVHRFLLANPKVEWAAVNSDGEVILFKYKTAPKPKKEGST